MVTNLYDYLMNVCRESISAHVHWREWGANTILYQPSQHQVGIYEVVKGVVKIGSHSTKGEEVTHHLAKPGDFFGNVWGAHVPFPEFAKTLTPVLIRMYQPSFFKRLTTHDPEISEWFTSRLMDRLYQTEHQLLRVVGLDAEEKVTRTLQQYHQVVEDAFGRPVLLVNLLTLQDIANLTGLTRQTVSKVVKKIQINA